MSVFQTLGGSWIVVPSLPSWVYHCSTDPSFDALQGCVPLSISSHVHILLYVLSQSLCGWPRTSLHLLEEVHNQPIMRFAYLRHMISEELVLASHDQRRACLFTFFYIKLFELGVEVAFNNRSAVTHHKVDLLKFPLWSISLEWIQQAAELRVCTPQIICYHSRM